MQHPPVTLPPPCFSVFPPKTIVMTTLDSLYCSLHFACSFQCHTLTLCLFSCRTIKVEVYDWDRDGRWVRFGWMCSKPFTTSRSGILVPNICFLTGASPLSFVLATTSLATIRPATESWLEGRVSLMYMRWVWLLIPYVTFLFPISHQLYSTAAVSWHPPNKCIHGFKGYGNILIDCFSVMEFVWGGQSSVFYWTGWNPVHS